MKIIITENLRAHATPPAPPVAPKFQPEPPHSLKVKRAGVNGGCLETARHQLICDTSNKLAEIARIDPARAQAINGMAAQIEALSAEYFASIYDDYNILTDYRSAARGRAITIEGIHAKERQLSSANDTLASPDSLKLSGEELMVLTQRTKHLPAIIKAEWEEIPNHEVRIRELEKQTGIPVERIVADLIEQLTGPDGRCSDLDLQRARDFLPLKK